MPVADTNLLIAVAKRDPDAIACMARQAMIIVPSLVLAEFLTGYAPEDRAAAKQAVEETCRVVHTDDVWIDAAAQLRHAARGRMVRSPDVWIAAWATSYGTSVMTRNVKDFEALGVPVEPW